MVGMNEIEAIVAEFGADLAATRSAARALVAAELAEPIDGMLGCVVVNGYGRLLRVELDRDALRHTDPGKLGPRIVRAVHAAEAGARRYSGRGDRV